ncbi:MAG: hypothetical protein J2P41_08815 [Blastocatellia bacterium]|nr:hypothetical protein [Blastocatellia bacterium]
MPIAKAITIKLAALIFLFSASLFAGCARKPERQLETPLPQYAERTLEYIERTGNPPQGYMGGSDFRNDGRGGGEVLPRIDSSGRSITYREWDVHPYTRGINRGPERLVTGSDGSAYFTSDHYRTFSKVR